jgi:hypothetical protein
MYSRESYNNPGNSPQAYYRPHVMKFISVLPTAEVTRRKSQQETGK